MGAREGWGLEPCGWERTWGPRARFSLSLAKEDARKVHSARLRVMSKKKKKKVLWNK